MRVSETAGEQESVKGLLEFLISNGTKASKVFRPHEDKPDSVLLVDGKIIACECTQIPPQQIYYEHVRKTKRSDWAGCDFSSKIWANEPHIWIANAIRKKTSKIPGYLSSSGATEAWLLIHSPPQYNQGFIESNGWVTCALIHGANTEPHAFAKIFLWTPQAGVRLVFSQEHGDPIATTLLPNFKDGYPISGTLQASFNFRTRKVGEIDPVSLRFFHESKNSAALIEPQDSRYRQHAPIVHNVTFGFLVRCWSDRAEITMEKYVDGQHERSVTLSDMANLAPEEEYAVHYLYEYHVPPRNFEVVLPDYQYKKIFEIYPDKLVERIVNHEV